MYDELAVIRCERAAVLTGRIDDVPANVAELIRPGVGIVASVRQGVSHVHLEGVSSCLVGNTDVVAAVINSLDRASRVPQLVGSREG